MSRGDYRDELFGKQPLDPGPCFPDDPAPSTDDVAMECVRTGAPIFVSRNRSTGHHHDPSYVLPAPENPKDAEARRTGKARLDLLEPVAEREIAKALAFGADKYGVRNFVTAPINARVYVAAMKRHIDAWLEGEDHADDSGAHHLGHIGANVHVALAAIAAGTFIDDRAATAAKDTSISDPAKVE